jgi:hypothetical protein
MNAARRGQRTEGRSRAARRKASTSDVGRLGVRKFIAWP